MVCYTFSFFQYAVSNQFKCTPLNFVTFSNCLDLKELKTIQYKRYETNKFQKFGQAPDLVDLKAIIRQEPSGSHTKKQDPANDEPHLSTKSKAVNVHKHTKKIDASSSNGKSDDVFSSAPGFGRLRDDKLSAPLNDHCKLTQKNSKCVNFDDRPLFVYNQVVPQFKNSNDIYCFKERYIETLKKGPYLHEMCAFAWPHLARNNSLIVANTLDKIDIYLPLICSRVRVCNN